MAIDYNFIDDPKNLQNIGTKKATQLTEDELELLWAAAPNPTHKALWILQYFTAARVSEALAQRWEWIDLEAGAIHYPKEILKGGKRKNTKVRDKNLSLHPRAIEALRELRATQHHKKTQPFEITRQSADKTLKRTAGKLGLEGVTTHSFRRSLVRNLMVKGVSSTKIRAITGHRSQAVFLEYD